jgi:outer membrane protein assembly factor BamD
VPFVSQLALRALAGAVLSAVLLAGCKDTPSRDQQSGPETLYQNAQSALKSNNYDAAIRSYEALEARFPFSDSARQGKLDLMYAYYKNDEPESAVDAADQFIRENPTHPRVDYAHYIKGLVYFERTPNFLERFFNVDLSARPPSDARKSFAAFGVIVERYPRSEYAHDARARMAYLRNRLADYEVAVGRYYMRRGAYVGALARSKYVIETYDGAPAVREAIEIMTHAYRELEMTELAAQTERIYKENFPDTADRVDRKNHWWWPF